MRAKSLWSLLAFGVAVIVVTPSGMAGDAGGKANYEKLCLSCHGADGKGNPAMTKVFGEKELNIAATAGSKKNDELIKVITEGKGKMSAVGKSLSKSDQKAVVDHIRSLAK